MAEGQVSVEGRTLRLAELFFVIATQNPVEFRGTYPLPEAQMDRFAMQFALGYVAPEEEVAILSAQEQHHPLDDVTSCVSMDDALRLRRSVRDVRVSDELRRYAVDLVRATRALAGVQLGASPRASLALVKAAQALALLVVAAAWSVVFRVRLDIQRVLPRFVTAGAPAVYRLVIRNGTVRPQRGLVLLEDLADPSPSFDEFLRAREPGEERRNWFDRTVGYPRWAWLIERRRGAGTAPRPLPPLPAGGAREVEVALLPLRRGRLAFTGVTIGRPDLFGLVNALVTIPLPGALIVLQKRYAVPDLALPGVRKYQRGGVALAGAVGDSEEFVSLRDYRPGDPLRRVHWRSAARVGRPVVKEYQDEFFVRHALVLDTFAEHEESDVFEEAVSVAASRSEEHTSELQSPVH